MGSKKKTFGKYGGNHHGRGLGNSRKRKEKQKGGDEKIAYIKKSKTTEAECLYPILKNIFPNKKIEFIDEHSNYNLAVSFDGKNSKDIPFIQLSGESKDVVNKELLDLSNNLLTLASTSDNSFLINDKRVYFPMFLNVGPYIFNESPLKRVHTNLERPYIAAYIARYSPEHRDKMFKTLKSLDTEDKVHGLGNANHTKDVVLPEHWYNLYSIYKDYLFGFAMENKEEDGYITEKIMNVYRGGAIPIYWGTSNVKEIFNSDSFIYVNDYESFEKCAEDVMSIVNDSERLKKMQEAPIFKENIDPDYSKYYDDPSPQWVIDIANKIKKSMKPIQKGGDEKIKAYVINLDKRTDRWEQIQKDFKGLPIELERFSAIENSDGHLGLGLSYLELVKKAKNENMKSILILEDDCLPVKDFINRWNSVKKWLDNNEDKWEVFNGCVFFPIDAVPVDTVDDIQLIRSDGLGARAAHFVIIKSSAYDKVLEWDKEKNGLFDYFINSNIFKNVLLNSKVLAGQHKGFSNTEKIDRNTELSQNNLKGGENNECIISYFTVSTKDTPELQRLKSSAEKFGWKLDVMGLEENTDQLGWQDKDNRSGDYGNFSIKLVKELEYVSNKNPDDIVLFTDAWDVICLGDCNSLYQKFLTFNKDLVFGAEKMCSPDADKKDLYKIQNAPFPYLNSGFFIGKAGVIKNYLDTYNGEKINDQKWWTSIYLDHQDEIALDSNATMCLQTWDTDEKYYQIQNNKFTYTETNTNPNFVHANGHIKDKLNLFTPLLQSGGNEERTTAYVINLINRTDRKDKITDAFKKSSIDLEFIEAIEVNEVNDKPEIKGAIGIGESFKKVIKEKAKNKPILIFEDDCKPINNFDFRWNKTKEWLDNNLDKWEIFSGGINTPQDATIKLEYSLDNDIHLFSSSVGWGMHFTYINPSVFNKILNFDYYKNGPLDKYLNTTNNFKFLVIYPFIGIQEEGMSNITKVYNSKKGHFDTSLYENELSKQSNKKEIIVDLIGGLGNRLFLYLAGLGFGEKWNMNVFVKNNEIAKNHVSNDNSINDMKKIFTNIKYIDNNKDISNYKIINEETEFIYNNINNPNENCIIKGYFQSEKYFPKNMPSINLVEPNNNIIKNIDKDNLFFIHFRFGDYSNKNDTNFLTKYYKHCINLIKQRNSNSIFIIITNDNNTTKNFIKDNLNEILNDNKILYTDDSDTSRLDSLYYMSQCSGGVCVNSTFSWFGAYLIKNKIKENIFFFKPWFNTFDTNKQYDIYPSWATIVDTNELNKQTGGELQKAYVMNLKYRPEKWEDIQSNFKDIFDLERFDAIKDEVGHRGCGKSFQQIIRIAKEKGMEEILILEDDCKPLENFKDRWNKVKYWLHNNKDKWEVFNGGLRVVGGSITNLVDTLDNGDKILSINKGVNCHMILVKNDAYDKILEWNWDKNWLIDFNYINTSKFKTLFVEPALSIQKDGYSNTEHIDKKNQLGGKSRRKNKHNRRKTRKNKQRGGSQNIHYITVSTKDTADLQNLIKSAKKNGWHLNVLGLEMNTSELGHTNKKFGMKLRLVKEYLSKCNSEDLLLFTDAWDVLVFGSKNDILEHYKKFNKSIVFNAEKFCWPDDARKNEYDTLSEEFPYLNSGGYIGKVKDIAKFLGNYNNEEDIDDQRFWTDQYIKNKDIIGLDHKNEIFICCAGTNIKDYSIENGKFKYKNRYPLIMHANGPGKEIFINTFL